MDNNSIAEDEKPKEEAANSAEAGTEKQSNTDWWEQDSIFKYFVEHTALFIACVSALIAVISFIIEAIAYGRDAIYLQRWGVDISNILMSVDISFYSIAFSGLYIISISLVDWYMLASFSSLELYFRKIYEEQSALKCQMRDLQLLEKVEKDILKDIKGLANFYTDSLLKKFQEAVLNMMLLKKHHKQLRRRLKKIHRILIKNLAIKLFLSALFCLVTITLMNIYSNGIGLHIVENWIISIVIISLIILWNILRLRRRVSRDLKGSKTEKNSSADSEIKSKKGSHFPRNSITNGILIQFTVIIIIGLITTMISEFLSSWINAQQKNEYAIYQDQQGVYAIIYHGEDFYIMEEASTTEKVLSIDTSSQRIIKSSDLSFTYQEFEDILIE